MVRQRSAASLMALAGLSWCIPCYWSCCYSVDSKQKLAKMMRRLEAPNIMKKELKDVLDWLDAQKIPHKEHISIDPRPGLLKRVWHDVKCSCGSSAEHKLVKEHIISLGWRHFRFPDAMPFLSMYRKIYSEVDAQLGLGGLGINIWLD